MKTYAYTQIPRPGGKSEVWRKVRVFGYDNDKWATVREVLPNGYGDPQDVRLCYLSRCRGRMDYFSLADVRRFSTVRQRKMERKDVWPRLVQTRYGDWVLYRDRGEWRESSSVYDADLVAAMKWMIRRRL